MLVNEHKPKGADENTTETAVFGVQIWMPHTRLHIAVSVLREHKDATIANQRNLWRVYCQKRF